MKLRLYHHADGARIAYREAGTGPPLALVHSAGLSHREWEPVVDALAHRYRLVLPDLPLHGDSEDRPTHPYTPAWLAEVLAGFLADVCGPRPLVGAHGLGGTLVLHAVAAGRLDPARIVLTPGPLHTGTPRDGPGRAAAALIRTAAIPGADRALSHLGQALLRPRLGDRLTATGAPGARDLVRHAFMDLGGNANRARSWGRAVGRWPTGPQPELLATLAGLAAPVLLLWADRDLRHPPSIAETALQVLRDGQLRMLPRTGFLLAYDDPVGLAREISAFCG